MKKEEKSTPTTKKCRSVLKYQLQATNQILKDPIDNYLNLFQSSSQSNKQNNAYFDSIEDSHPNEKQEEKLVQYQVKSINHYSQKKHPCYDYFQDQNYDQNQFQERQTKKTGQNHKPKFEYFKKQVEIQEDFFNSEPYYSLYGDYSRSFDKKPSYYQKQKDSNFKNGEIQLVKKQLKRQKRGLANISLKVKNIVAKEGKMSYKQVSQEVLNQSIDQIPSEGKQRQKEIKNIRRRVYDALNVLVSVGILGKSQRCVVITPETNVQGKKLSQHWEEVNTKTKFLKQFQKGCQEKIKNLNLLKRHYQSVVALRQRNKIIMKQEQKSQSFKKDSSQTEDKKDYLSQKFYFPLVFLTPYAKSTQNIKIEIQHQQANNNQVINKITITGQNLKMFTDIDAVNYLNQSKEEIEDDPKMLVENRYKQIQKKKSLENKMVKKVRNDFYEDIYLED